jgi:anti-anti-sigma factor
MTKPVKLAIKEDLICQNVYKIQKTLQDKLQADCGEVVLDLHKVAFIDSMGLKLIIGLYKSCQEKNRELRITGCAPKVHQILSLCGLNRYLHIEEA